MVKDLRTNVETGNTGAVDGSLDDFIEASLLHASALSAEKEPVL